MSHLLAALVYFAFCEFLMWRQRCRCRAETAGADRWEREAKPLARSARVGDVWELTVGTESGKRRVRWRIIAVEERNELPF